MRAPHPETAVGLVAILYPQSVPVLQAVGIDLALDNDRSLEDACAMRDLRSADVIARFAPPRPSAPFEPLGLQQNVWVPSAYLPPG